LSGIVFCCFTKKNKSSKNTDLTKKSEAFFCFKCLKFFVSKAQ